MRPMVVTLALETYFADGFAKQGFLLLVDFGLMRRRSRRSRGWRCCSKAPQPLVCAEWPRSRKQNKH